MNGRCRCIHTRSSASLKSRRVSFVCGSPSVFKNSFTDEPALSAPSRARGAADLFGIAIDQWCLVAWP